MGLFRRQMQLAHLFRSDNCNNSERSSRRIVQSNEAPFQTLGSRTLATTLGFKELSSKYFWLSVLSESISSYIYVFIVCATRISWPGMVIGHEPNLFAISIVSGVIMMLLMLMFRTVHVNPALTCAFFATGRIPLARAVIYVLVQCFSSVAAIAMLYSISVTGHKGALGLDSPHPILKSWQIAMIELMFTMIVTIVTYMTCSYSSYKNARQFILEQVGQHCADILDVNSTPFANENMASSNQVTNNHRYQNNDGGLLTTSAIIHHHQQQQIQRQRPATASYHTTALKRPMSASNSRLHPQCRGYLSDIHENPDFELEYDSDRICPHQEQSSPEVSPKPRREPTIEELMHSESQLLAPNGFTLLMNPWQAFCIGLAYFMASLAGLPSTGASLNPARSFGPAFIMNRWDHHWAYWVGPILGSVLAGWFFEVVLNVTRASSNVFLPQLFRLSANDVAKVASKSKLYQTSVRSSGLPPIDLNTTVPRPIDVNTTMPRTIRIHERPSQAHHFPTVQHSSRTRHQAASNLMSNATLSNPSMRDAKQQNFFAPSTSFAQPQHLVGDNFDQLNHIHAQRQQHYLQHQQQRQQQRLQQQEQQEQEQEHEQEQEQRQQHAGNNLNADCAPDVMALYDNPTGHELFVASQSTNHQSAGPMRVPFENDVLCSSAELAARQTRMFITMLQHQQQLRPGLARPSSQMIGGERATLDAAMGPTRNSTAFILSDGQTQYNQQARDGTTSTVRPYLQQRQFHMRQFAPDDQDENFYQLPDDQIDRTDKQTGRAMNDADSIRLRGPQGGSTGEGSQSNSSGTTNDTSLGQTNASGELVLSAELLASKDTNSDQNDYYN